MTDPVVQVVASFFLLLSVSCGAAAPEAKEQARVAACIAESKAQTQRDKQSCRNDRAACMNACTGSACDDVCKRSACTQEDIDAIFNRANERELSCLEPS